MPVILALGIQTQEDFRFEASLGYIARPCHQKQKQVKETGGAAQWLKVLAAPADDPGSVPITYLVAQSH